MKWLGDVLVMIAIICFILLAYMIGEIVGLTKFCKMTNAMQAPDICWELVQ